MTTETRLITAEEFMEMDFDVPVELVRGQIAYPYREDGMTRPGPRHGAVCSNIAFALGSWARLRKSGRVATNDSGILTQRDPDTIRGADVAYFPMERLPEGKFPLSGIDIKPQVCVEVLSPSNTYAEMAAKREEYLACGVEEVWVVDPEKRAVDVYRRDTSQLRFEENDTLTSRALPGFSVAVSDFFEGI